MNYPADVQAVIDNPESFIGRLTIMHKEKQRLSRFTLNWAQEELLESLQDHNRIIILKARQLGISTLTRGWNFWQAFCADQPRQYAVLSHTQRSSEELHRMEKTFYENLPEMLRKPLGKSSVRTLKFAESGAELCTYTAGGKGGTRSYAMNTAHLSEFAFYENQEEVMATVTAAVGEGQIVIESTPNMPNDMYHRLVKGALAGENEWKLVFFPWWKHPAYEAKPPHGWNITSPKDRKYQQEYGLTERQMYWRHKQIRTLGRDKFMREYPSSVEDAFQAIGANFFDAEKLSEITPIKLGKHQHRQYCLPVAGDSYVMGVDVSAGVGRKGDYSVITIVSVSTRQPVYHWICNKTSPSKLAEVILDLAAKYNRAKVVVESNGHGTWVLHRLKDLGVKNLWTDKNGKPFRTTSTTRPMMWEALKDVIDEGLITTLDEEALTELGQMVFIGGKPQAPKNKHDDITMSMCVAYYALKDIPVVAGIKTKKHLMEAHIKKMRGKKATRALPWNVTGGNATGKY